MTFKLYAAKWNYSDRVEVARLARLGFKFRFERVSLRDGSSCRAWFLNADRESSIEIKSLDELMALVRDWPDEGIVVNNDTITIYNGYLE